MGTKLSEFDVFVDRLPKGVAESLWFIPVKENKAADVPKESDLKKKEYRLSLEKARERIEEGENVGIVLHDQLFVLDVMDEEEAEVYLKDMPSTLEISTRSGKVHRYYLKGEGVKGKDIPGVLELRTGWRYVVAPGSYASNGDGESWGTYTVEDARKVADVTADELPSELRVEEKESKKGKEKSTRNEHGWRIEDIREDDETLDALLTRETPPNLGFISKKDADRKTIERLLYWEFSSKAVSRIMREYRDCGEEITSLSMDVLKDFQSSGEEVISDKVSVETFKPGSGQERRLKKKLEEKAFSDSKVPWDCDTKFVTFTSKVVLSSDNVIEKEETYELPIDLARNIINRSMGRKFVWECPRCKENPIPKEEPSNPNPPAACPNPECDRKKLRALHPTDHDEFAEAFMKNYHFATVEESIDESKAGAVHIYRGGAYTQRGAKGIIRGKIRQFNSKLKQHHHRQIIHSIATATEHPEGEFGISEPKVALENGTLNLETLELEEHDPSDLATSKIPVEYDPDAECPVFLDYLERMVPSGKDRKRLQELLGAALINKKPRKESAIIVGPTDTGKSTLIEIITGVFGEENVASQAPSTLADSRWGKAKLRNKLLNATDEVTAGRLGNLEILKRIMAGSKIEAEEKREKVFEFRPTCEHLYAANKTPTANRKDDAFWNRWIVIETPTPIPEPEQESDLPDKIVEKEAQGILNWIIEGYRRFADAGEKYTEPVDWEESRDKWLTWGDTIQRFIQRCVEPAKDAKISTRELHELHTQFARAHELETVSQHKLTQEIKKLDYANYSKSMRFEDGQYGGFRGIKVELPSQEESKELNSIQQFVRECINRKDGNKITGEKLYKLYSQFAGNQGMKIQGRKKITEKVKGLSYVEYSNNYRFDGKKKRGFKNIAIGMPETGDGSQKESSPKPSPESGKPSPKQPSKEQTDRGDENEEEGNRGNRENGDGSGGTVGGSSTTSRIQESQKDSGSHTKCDDISTNTTNKTVSSPTQRDKVNALRKIIRKLQDEYREGALLSAVKSEAEGKAIGSGFVDEFIKRGRKKGRIDRNEREGQVFVKLTERKRPDIGGSEEGRG